MKHKNFLTLAVMLFTLIFSATAFAGYWKNADNTVPAYRDSGLSNRTGNERVDAGDRIYVHQETNNAYEVSYPVGNTGKYKKRWVAKNVFNQATNNRNISTPQNNTNHNPQGRVDVAESPSAGVLHVQGIAYDLDNARASTRIHVYVGGGAGSGAPGYEIRTNGNNHVFDDTRQVGRTGRQRVHVYALNDYGQGQNVEIWNGYVDIKSNQPTPNRDFPNSIYLTQQGSNTCTLVSAAMMLRARAYLNGNNSWSSITESSIKNTAWSGGLKWSWSYMGMNIAHSKTSGISSNTLKSLLNQHPEGIVLHCANLPRMHAVWVIRYSGDTFYCSDPLKGYSGDSRPLANSYLGKQCSNNQASVLSNVTAYWYIQR